MLKSYGGWWVGVDGLQDFSVSPRSFGFGFETKGLGPGLDNMTLFIDKPQSQALSSTQSFVSINAHRAEPRRLCRQKEKNISRDS